MKCTEVKVHTSSKEPENVSLPINRVCSKRLSDSVLTFQGRM